MSIPEIPFSKYTLMVFDNFFLRQAGILLLLLLIAGTAWAQDQGEMQAAAPEKAEVMILGTSHFGNPGQDVINTTFPDVKQPRYQRQILAVVDSLLAFRPTKVALEARPDYRAALDSMYRAWREDTHELTRNERQQLGFRIAGEREHDRLYGIDYEGEFPFKKVVAYAKQHEPDFLRYFEKVRDRIESVDDTLYANATIREILRYKNSSENLAWQRDYYARTASVGDDSSWVGVDLVTEWHRRNIQIFAKLARITEPGDRVIVIFGSGHAPLLRYFVESSRRMELVDPLDYL